MTATALLIGQTASVDADLQPCHTGTPDAWCNRGTIGCPVDHHDYAAGLRERAVANELRSRIMALGHDHEPRVEGGDW